MARPIKETPILYGEDAERFVSEMEAVEARSEEEREASRKAFQERVKEAKKVHYFLFVNNESNTTYARLRNTRL